MEHSGGHQHGSQPTDGPPEADGDPTPAQFWEERYRGKEAVWSGRPNPALVAEVSGLTPGRALDLACGEGADSIWLAERGWQVTAVDISETALERGRQEAQARGLGENITWRREDLSRWTPDGEFDLVCSHYLHSPVELPREDILRRAAGTVAPGGVLLAVSHADFPPWADVDRTKVAPFLDGPRTVAALDLPDDGWEVLVCEDRTRPATGPDGQVADLVDVIVSLRRTA